ncbi:MAG: DUF1232 domain-containing protein [Candidatus Riflebacteria bacterium]|nr:DUF1232 domain-containing protein [Candidatus Riflebacteria bacterium]
MRTILIIISIIYVVSPIDAIPDITPMIGQADDLAALLIGIYNTYYIMKNNKTNIGKKSPDNK